MSETRTDSVAECEELLDAEIPCGGIATRDIARSCTATAVLRRHDHRCSYRDDCAANMKCMKCWQVWYQHVANYIARHGFVQCEYCHQRFTSVEAFSDYRPF